MPQKTKLLQTFLFLSTALLTAITHADPMSAADPVKQTQDALRDPALRNEPNVRPTADKIKGMTGGNPEQEQEMWNLSAELMPMLNELSGGDPEKMKAFLEESKKNPKAFLERMPAAQREKLRGLAEKMSKPKTP